ncbi:MAG: hypothetical protein SLAVMIC_01038 [uncultured marine phage]|uniref:Uncharacterized protein n=1 Tax=uncultured marine phage TaxID=707152 RepID=A0A8D9CD48_9VIRU|nr:MAG: hypothetical protein SLAVMIC_01038 [uncultured marine phage]
MAKNKFKNKKSNFKVSLPKTRYEVNKDKKISYAAAEVDIYITKDDVKTSETDFKIYKNVATYVPGLSRWKSDSYLEEEGFATLEDAIKRVDELVS